MILTLRSAITIDRKVTLILLSLQYRKCGCLNECLVIEHSVINNQCA